MHRYFWNKDIKNTYICWHLLIFKAKKIMIFLLINKGQREYSLIFELVKTLYIKLFIICYPILEFLTLPHNKYHNKYFQRSYKVTFIQSFSKSCFNLTSSSTFNVKKNRPENHCLLLKNKKYKFHVINKWTCYQFWVQKSESKIKIVWIWNWIIIFHEWGKIGVQTL